MANPVEQMIIFIVDGLHFAPEVANLFPFNVIVNAEAKTFEDWKADYESSPFRIIDLRTPALIFMRNRNRNTCDQMIHFVTNTTEENLPLIQLRTVMDYYKFARYKLKEIEDINAELESRNVIV